MLESNYVLIDRQYLREALRQIKQAHGSDCRCGYCSQTVPRGLPVEELPQT